MATWITDNNSFNVGSAQDSSQTDNFTLAATGTTILGIGGNINVTGLPFPPATTPIDTNTTALLWSVSGAISGVTDNFTLHGSGNSLSNTAFGILTPIAGSTINDTVLGNGGFNSVNLTSTSSSTVKVMIGVDGSAFAPAGHNNVLIQNSGGINTVAVGGPANTVNLLGSTNTVFDGGSAGKVTLNGMATNNVMFGGGGATATIGFKDDDHFGFSSTVVFSGTGNLLNGGDQNYTVSGSTGASAVHLGDGENNITMGGTGNTVTVWGGDNTINAGGGGSIVKILGLDGANTATPTDPDGPDDAPVPLSPIDYVMISGAGDSVSATYENVNIWGALVSGAIVNLGDGNNAVILSGSGSNKVNVGDGGNAISVTGNSNIITVGHGANGVTLNGNGNTVTVHDTAGVGNDIVQLGAGTGDIVALDHAAGSVTGFGLGTTTVTQSGPNNVNVNLNGGTGLITLGDGNDTVTANGGGTTVKAGKGNDIVTANGPGDTITLGDGNNIVTANGPSDKINLGNGNNTVTANGPGDSLILGNGNNKVMANGGGDKFTFGNGNNTVTANGNGDVGTFGTPGLGGNNSLVATGAGDFWTFNEATTSTVTAALGTVSNGGDTLTQTNGSLNATLFGPGDTVNLSNVNTLGTTITSNGNSETFNFKNNSGGVLVLNPVSVLDKLNFTGAAHNFAGTASVVGLNAADTVTLTDLYTTGGTHITSFGQMLGAMSFVPTGDVLPLQGGGALQFAAGTPLVPTSFHYA